MNASSSNFFIIVWKHARDSPSSCHIEATRAVTDTFGTITKDGKTYEHDVIVCLSSEVVKRKKKLSKKYYGTSHILSKDGAKLSSKRGASS